MRIAQGPGWWAAAGVVLASACASAGGGREPRPAVEPPATAAFARAVAPFPVLDARGRPYELPFLGGLDVPRPQFVDIDDDGDPDLFVHELGGTLWFLENTGTPETSRFEWRSDRYGELDVGEWARFVDLDGDGDFDVIAELPYGYVRVHRNTGTPERATFTAEQDSLRDASGRPLYVDRQNLPTFVDLDCNGRLDMIAGQVEGVATRYEAVAQNGTVFGLVTEYFEGIEIIGQVEGVGTRLHGANALSFADGDADGDPDLYWGDFFEPGVLLIENVGPTCAAFSFDVAPMRVPGADSLLTSGYNVPALTDLDGDGDLDFLMGVLGGAYDPIQNLADNFYHWERLEGGGLAFRTKRFLYGIDSGSESVPAVGDLDGDGDPDLLVGSRIDPVNRDAASLLLLRNEGTRSEPSFRLADTLRLSDAYHHAPALGDLDADGDLDLMLGTWNRNVLFFRNVGSPTEPRFEADPSVELGIGRAGNAVPALVDLDGDGDLDLLVGETTGELTFVRNDGTPSEPRFALETDRLGDIDVGRRSAPAVVDLDGDGLLDLVVGRESVGVRAFRNGGTAREPRWEPHAFDLPLPPYATPVFVDLDGDGRLEVLAGGVGGGLVYYR